MERLKGHFDTLENYHADLQQLFNKLDTAVDGFNYVSKNKKKIELLIETINQTKFNID
jgi:hypothetical protein